MPIVIDARTVTDHFPGIGRYVANLTRALKAVAPDLDLALLRGKTAHLRGLPLPELPGADSAASPFSVWQQLLVPRQLRDLGATLYHSPYYLMPYRPGPPTVLTVYDAIPLACPQYYSLMQRLIFRLAHRMALRSARVVLAISESTKADLLRHFKLNAAKLVVTPLAAEGRFAPQTDVRLQSVREKYRLPLRYVLYFGSNKPHKNLPRLVTAFLQSARRGCEPEAHLVIAGSWDARFPEAQKAAAGHRSVHFLGPVAEQDLPALYAGALVFAFVSEYEGFGLPPLEAMACGTPVIAGNTSSLPEVVGDAGLLVDPRDIGAISSALDRALGDAELRSDLSRRSLERAARFSWEITARQTLDAYRSIMTVQ
jgi:glycosyltransferase involved in cell wall biosynthesis